MIRLSFSNLPETDDLRHQRTPQFPQQIGYIRRITIRVLHCRVCVAVHIILVVSLVIVQSVQLILLAIHEITLHCLLQVVSVDVNDRLYVTEPVQMRTIFLCVKFILFWLIAGSMLSYCPVLAGDRTPDFLKHSG